MVRNAGGRQATGGVLDYRAPVHYGGRAFQASDYSHGCKVLIYKQFIQMPREASTAA